MFISVLLKLQLLIYLIAAAGVPTVTYRLPEEDRSVLVAFGSPTPLVE
jgi:hypothetical protein